MSISTKLPIKTPSQMTNPFVQEPKPPSFWQQIKFMCNKIFCYPLFSNKTKFKVYENPIYRSDNIKAHSTHMPKTSNDADNLSISMDIISKTENIQKDRLQSATNNIDIILKYIENRNAIKAQKKTTYEEQKKHHQFNKLDKAIRLHPEFASTEGIFRLSGKKTDMNNIFERLNSGKQLTQKFIDEHNISLPSMTLAYKELFGQIMDKQDYSTDFLNKSPDRALSDALQNQRDVIELMKNNGITGEKEKIILANTKTRINWETPTLPFNMLISLLADIAKNPATKMDAKNLAICVAPRLLAEQFKTPSKENILLNNRMITFIEILIHTKLHA
ncbi:RhoGAP domain-containing protein [Providencia rettgeri]